MRNSLSKSFLKALAIKDAEQYRKKAGNYHALDLEQPYHVYVEDRLDKYNQAFEVITREGLDDILQQAEVFWTHGLYFEMHELLEKLWADASGVRRKALQALIRAAGMKMHAENGNMEAAVSMGRKAQADLESYGSALGHFPALKGILAEVAGTLAILK